MGWTLLFYTLEVLKWIILARVLMSWFVSPYSRNPIVEGVRKITDPILEPISSVLPNMGGFDLSPIVAFFAITFLQRAIFAMA